MTKHNSLVYFLSDLEHTLTVSSDNNPVLAGTRLTFTCKAVVSRPVQLKWLNSDGSIINSTTSVTLSDPVVEGRTTTITLTLDPLKTGHAGIYTCVLFIDKPHLIITTSHKLFVKSKIVNIAFIMYHK